MGRFILMNKITLYTISCPKCKQLEKRLNERNIKYEICTDANVMKSLGISSVPYLQVNDELMDFAQAWKWASLQEVKK
jgi:glutaredoxin